MELDPNLSFLIRNLKVDDPWIPPKPWESIPSESGPHHSPNPPKSRQDSCSDLTTIPESTLVRLAINALQGMKPSLLEIDRLSVELRSVPSHLHQIPSLWCRSLSTSALGSVLESIGRSGLVIFSVREFVSYYLYPNSNGECAELEKSPPFSLVNQAFCVAVGKVLEGHVLSLDTLLTAVKVRRVGKSEGSERMGVLTSVVSCSDVTLLEVYLHTEELRTYVEAIGSVCFPNVEDFAALKGVLMGDGSLELGEFPRGADLLTYLYVLLRDADPGHHALLKYMFVQSFEPYCCFIKSWIYHARIDDPYGEFFVAYLDNSLSSTPADCSVNDYSVASIKERDCTSIPCFLKDVRRPLIRAGLQLEVLVKLLNLCNFVLVTESEPSSLTNFNDILPFWVDTPNNSASLLDTLAFSRKGIQALLHNRTTMYSTVMEKLQMFFMKLDIGHQRINRNVIPLGSLFGRSASVNSPFPMVYDGELNNSSNTMDQEAINVFAGTKDSDSTSFASSNEVDPSHSSDSSSSLSYEDEDDFGAFPELPDMSRGSSQFPFSNLRICNANRRQNSETLKVCPQGSLTDKYKSLVHGVPFGRLHQENEIFCNVSAPIESDTTKCAKLLETWDEGCLSGRCWPLGVLPKNPFYADMKYRVPKHLQFTGDNHLKDDICTETLEEEERDTGEMFAPFICKSDATGKVQSWNSYSHYNLSINPMLTKAAWLRTPRSLRDSNLISNDGPYCPHFDFSSVADPCKGYSENTAGGQDHEFQGEAPKFMASSVPIAKVAENSVACIRDNMADQLVRSSVCSSREENVPSDVLPISSGGAGWEGSLNFSLGNAYSGDTPLFNSMETFEIPLDVIIDKCILQEILVQYKYVSDFAIKLLEEGFDLREHLLALRRYHFMELADWADTFIMSLRNHKWSAVESEQNIAKIQGVLDLALQRSSCENDQYKERLFVYTKGQSIVPKPTCTGLHAFDYMVLGYRVDWPVNIIITQDALKTYAEIFNYLVQVRLAVVSLTEIWHWLKARAYSTKQSQNMGSHKKDFAALMKMRQQINHFVRTLQHYVHSQLSDVSWCKFQHSLNHQVKDMLDLESVHMTYLHDALHTCFLSAETKQIAPIIKNILQCALDFRLCFPERGLVDVRIRGGGALDLRCQIDFSQVFAIKLTFDKNIKDLYSLYLKSPKHGEFSLSRFWNYLNYNDYYSVTIAKEMHRYYH